MILNYDSYASNNPKDKEAFNDATLIGNGFMGATIYGHPYKEKVILNEDSFWLGKKNRKRENKDFYKYYPKIKELVNNNQIKEAERLLKLASFSSGGEAIYSVAGRMEIDFLDKGEVSSYSRTLNLDDAICNVSYEINGNKIEREAFASYKGMVLAFNIKSEKPVSFDITLDKEKLVDKIEAKDNTIILTYDYNKKDKLAIVAKVVSDGVLESIGQNICVKDSTNTYIYLALRTTFYSKNPIAFCKKKVNSLDYEALKLRHIEDYHSIYYKSSLTTSSKKINELYAFARYLMISSSRKNSNPANLQGLWCQDIFPAWDSKYTININLEMNYWFTLRSNLLDCLPPYFSLLKRIHKNGKRLSKKMYHANGFCAFHNSDIYGDCAPQDKYLPATYWPIGGAWLSLMIYDYYTYTKDIKFLKKYIYILNDSCRFFANVLEKNEEGCYVLNPSLSPENSYILDGDICHICKGCTMDAQILDDLFSYTKYAFKALNKKLPLEFEDILANLPKNKISQNKTICEWNDDYTEAEPGHRHISMLYGLYPSSQITEKDKELFEAAKNTIDRRLSNGGGHTGWSKAWIICFYARLNQGELAYKTLDEMIEKSISKGYLDLHPPFQIDGNFGIAAGINEMIIREVDDCVELLPAICEELSSGELKGIRIKGDAILDIKWDNMKLTSVDIKANKDIKLKLKCKNTSIQLKGSYLIKKGEKLQIAE